MVCAARKTKGKLGKDISKPVVKRKVKRSDNSMLGIAEGEKGTQYKKLEEGGPAEKLTHVRTPLPCTDLSSTAHHSPAYSSLPTLALQSRPPAAASHRPLGSRLSRA